MDNSIILLIIPIAIVTYSGLRDFSFNKKYIFHTENILSGKEYYRIISSGFLHSSWIHFGFNMVALHSFGSYVIYRYGFLEFLLIFFGSLITGSLLSLFIHRNHADYRALGASGAVSGVVFSTIVADPLSPISFLFIPMEFQAWIIGALFIAASIWGIKKNRDNIGHDAHLGGAIFGILIMLAIQPSSIYDNWWTYALLGIPSVGFTLFIIKNPTYIMYESMSISGHTSFSKKKKKEKNKEEELNRILDKINEKGIENISKKDKAKLEELTAHAD